MWFKKKQIVCKKGEHDLTFEHPDNLSNARICGKCQLYVYTGDTSYEAQIKSTIRALEGEK